jgi:FkbM family methyltransferase
MSFIRKEFRSIASKIENSRHLVAFENLKASLAGRPLVLYGCGQICKTIISICQLKGTKISAVCDSRRTGIYDETGFTIISPKELKEKYNDAAVMVTSMRFENEIMDQIKRLGFSDSQIYPFPLPHTYVQSPEYFEETHLEGYEWAYAFFRDDISRKIILERMNMHLLGTTLTRTSSAATYFEPGIISLSPNEVFIDGGCFKGETALEFIRQAEQAGENVNFHIYSFEPDVPICKAAIENLKSYVNVDVIPKGLWNAETELKFFSDGGSGGSSFVLGQTSVSVPVTSLDAFFSGKPDGELPTFIKLDIEGAEREALLGSKTVIRKKHPKLAICVYHKPEDIYDLPRLINEIDPSYKCSLQQCADGTYDTVMYAV